MFTRRAARAYDKKFKALVPQCRIRCKISLKGRPALHLIEVQQTSAKEVRHESQRRNAQGR